MSKKNKVAGSIQEKNGKWYLLINYMVDRTPAEMAEAEQKEKIKEAKTGTRSKVNPQKRVYKWVSTGLSIKNNRRNAEAMLAEYKANFEIPKAKSDADSSEKILFHEYAQEWLNKRRRFIAHNTLSNYQTNIEKKIIPYFKERMIYLEDLTEKDIRGFYEYYLSTGVKAVTVKKCHGNIRTMLADALEDDLIKADVLLKIKPPKRPKEEIYKAEYFSAEEMNLCFKLFEDDPLHLIVKLTAFYGLRRGEVLGLKWRSIDFVNKTISIESTRGSCVIDGKLVFFENQSTKTESSYRTMPLVPEIEKLLAEKLRNQETLRRTQKDKYNQEFIEYVNVDNTGKLMKPDYLTNHFRLILIKNSDKIKRITFHGLRHSVASLLVNRGMPMPKISDWLGHSSTEITDSYYAHLDKTAKTEVAKELQNSGLEIE